MPEIYASELDALRREGRLRSIPGSMPQGMLDFTSNDYLGISASGHLEREFLASLSERPGLTSSASRLLACRQDEYAALEKILGEAYGRKALLFNSGYHANVGCVSALASAKGALMVCDKLVHASVIDGLRMSGASFLRFRHNDLASLRRLLEKHAPQHDCVWVVVESVYSMDGDTAPLRELVALKREYPQLRLYVDEAHALGVRGLTGLGLCEEEDVISEIDLIIGTIGKALASCGAFAAASAGLRDYLLNSARSFIFSTMLPPMNVAYTSLVFRAMRSMTTEREHLASLSSRLREGLGALAIDTGTTSSHIIPWITGSSELAARYASGLRERGIMAMPIRRPTVAAGTERVRLSLSAGMTTSDIDRLLLAAREISTQA